MKINDILYETEDTQKKNLEKEYRAILKYEKQLKSLTKNRRVVAALQRTELKKAELEKQLGRHLDTNIAAGKRVEIELSDEMVQKAFSRYWDYEPINSLYSKFLVTISKTGTTSDGYVTKFIRIPLPEYLLGEWDYNTMFKSSREWKPVNGTSKIDRPEDIPNAEDKDIILVDGDYYIIPIYGPVVLHKNETRTYGAVELNNFVKAKNRKKQQLVAIDARLNDMQHFDKIIKKGSDEWVQLLKKAGFEDPENWTHWSS